MKKGKQQKELIQKCKEFKITVFSHDTILKLKVPPTSHICICNPFLEEHWVQYALVSQESQRTLSLSNSYPPLTWEGSQRLLLKIGFLRGSQATVPAILLIFSKFGSAMVASPIPSSYVWLLNPGPCGMWNFWDQAKYPSDFTELVGGSDKYNTDSKQPSMPIFHYSDTHLEAFSR